MLASIHLHLLRPGMAALQSLPKDTMASNGAARRRARRARSMAVPCPCGMQIAIRGSAPAVAMGVESAWE
jgi:hypothetical protein